MQRKSLAILVIVLILALLLLNYGFLGTPQIEESPDFYVGVDVAYADLAAIKRLIDEISPYTNLFVIGSTGVTYNVTKLNEIYSNNDFIFSKRSIAFIGASQYSQISVLP